MAVLREAGIREKTRDEVDALGAKREARSVKREA
jgi:hypothetical protein